MCCSVSKSCPTCCDPVDCSMTGFPVPHHLPEFAQVHAHCIGDAIHAIMLQWCHASEVLFSFCPQSFPASQSFPMHQLLASTGQIIEAFSGQQQRSCSATQEILNKNQVIYEWFSTRFPTNWGAVIGEGMTTFLATPSVPGRWALCS